MRARTRLRADQTPFYRLRQIDVRSESESQATSLQSLSATYRPRIHPYILGSVSPWIDPWSLTCCPSLERVLFDPYFGDGPWIDSGSHGRSPKEGSIKDPSSSPSLLSSPLLCPFLSLSHYLSRRTLAVRVQTSKSLFDVFFTLWTFLRSTYQ